MRGVHVSIYSPQSSRIDLQVELDLIIKLMERKDNRFQYHLEIYTEISNKDN